MNLLDLPPKVARRFLEDLRAYHTEPDGIKRDEIAARQRHILAEYMPLRAKKLRLVDIKELLRIDAR
jgi:hypothetical protein